MSLGGLTFWLAVGQHHSVDIGVRHQSTKLPATVYIHDYAQIATLGHVTRTRITQIMGLTLIAPDIPKGLISLGRIDSFEQSASPSMEQSDLPDEPAGAGIFNELLVRLRLNGLDSYNANQGCSQNDPYS